MSSFLSYIFERSGQQEPVLQHAGFPSEVYCGKSENSSGSQEQFGLPTPAGVSFSHTIQYFIGCIEISHISVYFPFSFPTVWWCSWPETFRRTFIRTSLTFSSSSPPCWTQRIQRCWSGLSPASPICISTCGGSW